MGVGEVSNWEPIAIRPWDPDSPVLNLYSKAHTLEFFREAEAKARAASRESRTDRKAMNNPSSSATGARLTWPWNTRFHRAFLAGWDSALIHPHGPTHNPYQRADFRSRFQRGREQCLANADLPEWAKWPYIR